MATWKIVLVSCLLVMSVSGQQTTNKKPASGNTRGHFGSGFGGRPGGGGFQQGGYQQGGFQQGGFGGRPGGFGGRPGGFGQGGFGQGGFGQGGFGQQGFGGQPGVSPGGFQQPGGFPGSTVGGISSGIGSSQCRYWCKTPEGQAYCCESSNTAPKPGLAAIIDKPGLCPPVRAVCPLRAHFGPPQTCSKHGDCFNADRCCFDRCLGEHVCKAPIPYQG